MESGNGTLVIYPFLPPADDGGAEYYLNLCTALSRTRTVHVVIYERPASEELRVFFEGANIKTLDLYEEGWKRPLRCAKIIRDYVKQNAISKLIHIYPAAHGSRRKKFLVPIFFPLFFSREQVDLVLFKIFPVTLNPISQFCSLIVHLFSSRIYCHEQSHVDLLRRTIGRLGFHRYFWIPAGADVESTTHTRATSPAFTFGFTGFVYRSKGAELLIEAFHRICLENPGLKLQLKFVGGRSPSNFRSPYEKKILRLIEDYQIGDSVVFTGNLESIDDFYRQCASVDCMVFPFVRLFTARSSLPPAIALGIPTILAAPNTKQSGFFVHDAHGRIVSPGNVKPLMAEMMYMVNNPGERARFASAIKELAGLYSWNSVIASLDNGGNDWY